MYRCFKRELLCSDCFGWNPPDQNINQIFAGREKWVQEQLRKQELLKQKENDQ